MKNIKLMLMAIASLSVGLGATDSNVDGVMEKIASVAMEDALVDTNTGLSVGLDATDLNVDATTTVSTEATTSFVDKVMKTAEFASIVVSDMAKSVSTELYNTFNDHYVDPNLTDIRCLVVEDSYIKSGYEKAKGLAGDVLFEADAHPYATAGIVVGIVAVTAGSVYAYQQYSKNDTEVKNS